MKKQSLNKHEDTKPANDRKIPHESPGQGDFVGEFYKAFKGGLNFTENRTGGDKKSYRLIL